MATYKKKQLAPISITWKPNRAAKEPMYSQIVSYFSKKISSGDWISGQIFPSQRKLSELFGVNRSTIVEAMNELISLGLIESSYGGGTRVTSDGWSLLMQDKAPDWQSYIKAGIFHPNIPTVKLVNRFEFEKGITRMSTGELSPDLVQADITKKALAKLSDSNLYVNYPDPFGMPELRKAVKKHLSKIGIDVPISCILIVSGALQALLLISIGIVHSKARVYVESPSYLNSLNIFQTVGAELRGVPMDKSGIMPWMIREPRTISMHSLLYTIPTFQNPTTIVMPITRRKEIVKYCLETHLPIIEDDVFRDLWLDEAPPIPLKALDYWGVVVYIGSLSKCFAPGLRIGWLVGSEAVVQRLADVKMQMDYGVSVLTQQVVEDLFRTGQYYVGVDNIRSQLRGRRDFMIQLLETYFSDIAEWECPAGGFFIWVRLKDGLSAERLFKQALNEGLLVMPGNVYGEDSLSAIRLTYGYLPLGEMEMGVKRLSEILNSF